MASKTYLKKDIEKDQQILRNRIIWDKEIFNRFTNNKNN